MILEAAPDVNKFCISIETGCNLGGCATGVLQTWYFHLPELI